MFSIFSELEKRSVNKKTGGNS